MNRGQCGGVYQNPSTWKVETQGSGVQDQSRLYSKFQANVGYSGRPCFKKRPIFAIIQAGDVVTLALMVAWETDRDECI